MQKVKNIYISHVECFITIDRYNPPSLSPPQERTSGFTEPLEDSPSEKGGKHR